MCENLDTCGIATFKIFEDSAYKQEDIKLPERQTSGSAGYDFYAPKDIVIKAKSCTQLFGTGVCVEIKQGWVLFLFPRSSLGNKGIRITNTVGVIDSDYRLEIKCNLVNDSNEDIVLTKGDRYMQGVFVPFGVIIDDKPVKEQRIGGLGSTGK